MGNLKQEHKATMFRDLFTVLENFVSLMAYIGRPLKQEELILFDLESPLIKRKLRNDVSYITKDKRLIILVEHQSAINPNMALRLFIYYIEILVLWVKEYNVNLYGSTKITCVPAPEFYVLYNGKEKLKENTSTFEIAYKEIQVNVTVNIMDIDYHKLKDKDKNNPLVGYSYFYKLYDNFIDKGLSKDEAFKRARETTKTEGYLKGFIERSEFAMYDSVMNYEEELFTRGIEQGIEQGIELEKTETAKALLGMGLTVEQVAKGTRLPIEEVERIKVQNP